MSPHSRLIAPFPATRNPEEPIILWASLHRHVSEMEKPVAENGSFTVTILPITATQQLMLPFAPMLVRVGIYFTQMTPISWVGIVSVFGSSDHGFGGRRLDRESLGTRAAAAAGCPEIASRRFPRSAATAAAFQQASGAPVRLCHARTVGAECPPTAQMGEIVPTRFLRWETVPRTPPASVGNPPQPHILHLVAT